MEKIMFNDKYGLTIAVLDGRKTMTRRLVPQGVVSLCERGMYEMALGSTKYKVGEIVAIAQAYRDASPSNDFIEELAFLNEYRWSKGWRNKMFVRADRMPHQIRITNIRIEKLQDISDEDCMKEGIMEGEFMNTWDTFYYDEWGDVPNHITSKSPRKAFAALIDKVSGKGTWASNPWVFVYEFELVK